MAKRGELTVVQIALIVLAIAGFIIVLMFILGFDFRGVGKQEACRLSVIVRGTVPQAMQNYIPLNCATEKICLVGEGGKGCKESFAGENIDGKIKLSKNIDEAAEKVTSVYAEKMYECWKMMGEGKVDLTMSISKGLGLSFQEKPLCIICSRIAVDMGAAKREEVYKKVDLGKYLQTHQASSDSSKTYLEHFTDGQVSSYSGVKGKGDLRHLSNGGTSQGNDIEVAVIFSQIKTRTFFESLKTLGSIAVGGVAGSFLVSPTWTIKGMRYAAQFASKYPVAVVVLLAGEIGYVTYNTYEGRVASAIYCGESQGPDGKIEERDRGCSMVSVVPYDSRMINEMCGYVESKP